MLVYAILLFVKFSKTRQQSNLWLGLFLFVAVLYITPWMVGFAGWYNKQPYRDILFYAPFQHLFLIGPFIFFYINSLFNPSFKIGKKEMLHFLPATVYFLYSLVVVVYDKLIVKEYYFLENQQDPDFDTWYQVAGFISMIGYLMVSLKYYQTYKKAIEAILSNTASFLFLWVRNFLIAFLFILLAWMVLALANTFFQLKYIDTWWYFFGFAIGCYYIAIAGYANAVESKIFFKTKIFTQQNQVLLQEKKSLYLEDKNQIQFEELEIENRQESFRENRNEYESWKQKIEEILYKQKMYEEPELTLFDVAKKLNTNISLLSKAINSAFRCNFNDLVNGYRIKAFENLIALGQHKQQTILSLAYECGFNSKATFNRAFKKVKGISPQEFIKKTTL
jgi:AraC-like DNA-binding protein